MLSHFHLQARMAKSIQSMIQKWITNNDYKSDFVFSFSVQSKDCLIWNLGKNQIIHMELFYLSLHEEMICKCQGLNYCVGWWVNWMNLKGQSISCLRFSWYLFWQENVCIRSSPFIVFCGEISSIFPCIIGTGI